MKNKRNFNSLIAIIALIFICQSIFFGQDLNKAKKSIDDLSNRVDDFIENPKNETSKKTAVRIKADLNGVKEDFKKLNEEIIQTEEGKREFQTIANKFNGLSKEFNPVNPINIETLKTDSAQQKPQTEVKLSDINDELQDLKDRTDKLEKTTLFGELTWTKLGLISLILLIFAGGIVLSGYLLLSSKRREREEIANKVGSLTKALHRSEREIEQLKKVLTDLSSRIARQKNDISRLSQTPANSQTTAADNTPSPLFSDNRFEKPEPKFPSSVDDYLAKVGRGAIHVKYDYKERMLVQDGERDGGLLIVRDDAANDGYLYLIPSFGFFQTKSDYTNYFEQYYACAKPMGGTVWIRQPATVNQISGGWQLAHQGELEIR